MPLYWDRALHEAVNLLLIVYNVYIIYGLGVMSLQLLLIIMNKVEAG